VSTAGENVISTFKEIFQTALVSFGIFLVVYIFLIQPHRVQGISMVPTYENRELLLTEKVSYRFSKPQRGDVVVFEAPLPRKVDFIKRIIGLPGETVSIRDGDVYINSNQLTEKYINIESSGDMVIKLLDDQYFVMGDNRGFSSDSRAFGPIKKKSIHGRVWLVYWPIVKSGDSARGFRLISGIDY
jgi:signal peptidase I